MTREELRQGYWDLVGRLYHAPGVPRTLLASVSISGVPAATGRDLPEGRGRQEAAHAGIRTDPAVVLGWALWRAGALTSVGRVYLKYFCSRYINYRRDIIGFAQVHEPLRYPLALLSIHP